MDRILDYLGHNPKYRTLDEAALDLPRVMDGFHNIPPARWLAEAARLWRETPDGLQINYDPRLRDAVLASADKLTPDLWPLFDTMAGLPLALLRGKNSNLLSPKTVAEMRRRRPDMLFGEVPDRAHIPLLDEPESLVVIRDFIGRIA